MNKVLLGPVFPSERLEDRERAILEAELKEIETDLVRRRALLATWQRRAANLEIYADVPDNVRAGTLEALEIYTDLMASGERLRAMLIATLYSLPEYAPSYSLEN